MVRPCFDLCTLSCPTAPFQSSSQCYGSLYTSLQVPELLTALLQTARATSTAPTTQPELSSAACPAHHSRQSPHFPLLAGMGAQKDMGLSFYAEAFAKGGLAAFVFDYRSFGGSDGEPRQWVSPSRHVQVGYLV
jgi:hypothetical protein